MASLALPYVDEHTTLVDAPREQVWSALVDTLAHTFDRAPAAAYAQVVGCADTASSGPRPLSEGSAFPGFHVTAADVGARLALEGRHRFSAYALLFTLADEAGGTRVRAETRAAFPGVTGGLYRTAVLRSGGHVLGVRRLLRGVRRRAEQQP